MGEAGEDAEEPEEDGVPDVSLSSPESSLLPGAAIAAAATAAAGVGVVGAGDPSGGGEGEGRPSAAAITLGRPAADLLRTPSKRAEMPFLAFGFGLAFFLALAFGLGVAFGPGLAAGRFLIPA